MSELLVISEKNALKDLAPWGPFSSRPSGWFISLYRPRDENDLLRLYQQCRRLFGERLSVGVRPLSLRPKALFFDMDATLIAEESIDCLAMACGHGDKVAAITEQAMAGDLSFKEALVPRVALLKGLPLAKVEALAGELTLQPQLEELLEACRHHGIKLFTASGGFNAIVAKMVQRLGMDGYFANELEVENGLLTGLVRGAVVDGQAKANYLMEVCKAHNWPANDVVAIGDGANDRWMLAKAGLGIGFQPKEVLYDFAQAVDHRGNYLFLQEFLFSHLAPGEGE